MDYDIEIMYLPKKTLEILNNMKPVEIKKKENENKDIIKNDFDLLTYN